MVTSPIPRHDIAGCEHAWCVEPDGTWWGCLEEFYEQLWNDRGND